MKPERGTSLEKLGLSVEELQRQVETDYQAHPILWIDVDEKRKNNND